MSPFIVYYHVLLLICALTGSFLVRRYWPLWAKLLVTLSWVTQVAEMLAFFCVSRHIHHYVWYALWVFVETLVLLYALFYEVTFLWAKRLYKVLLIVLPLGVTICLIVRPPFAYIGLFYLFLDLVAAGTVLIDILKDVSDTLIRSRPAFWLATGMLFFSSLFIVVYSLGEFLGKISPITLLPFGCLANTFMYGGFKKKGEVLANIQFDNGRLQVHMPVNGNIISINDTNLLINQDLLLTRPETDGWLVKILVSQPCLRKGLMLFEEYNSMFL